MILKRLLFSSLFSVILVWTQTSLGAYGSNRYYDTVFLGERNFEIYSGPLDPKIHYNEHIKAQTFLDEIYYNTFFENNLEKNIFEWDRLWNEEMPAMSYCPNFYLNENIDYIRYLYRLISISYLFESIKDHAKLSYKLGYNSDVCDLDWDKLFGKCSPKSKNMKTFIERAKYRYLLGFDPLSEGLMTLADAKEWVKTLHQNFDKETITGKRLNDWCLEKKNCGRFSYEELQEGLANVCNKDSDLIQKICSEEDNLYGISHSKIPKELLLKSNITRVINNGGFASACLNRFSLIFKERESYYPWLEEAFPLVKKKLEKEGEDYLQGQIFIPGALKEFDDRGLTSFLFVEPTPTPIPTPEPTPTPAPKIVEVRPTPKPEIKPTPVPLATPTPKPTPAPVQLSQFEMAVKKLNDEKLKLSHVDMKKFSGEFPQVKRLMKAIEGPLRDYQTRKALTDMKKYDKLGSESQPMRLLFLKLLIDQDSHVGLWNIVSIIGEKFYVINDLDKKNDPILVKLHNSQETNGEWQLTILSDQK
jgi:hypothetical protein